MNPTLVSIAVAATLCATRRGDFATFGTLALLCLLFIVLQGILVIDHAEVNKTKMAASSDDQGVRNRMLILQPEPVHCDCEFVTNIDPYCNLEHQLDTSMTRSRALSAEIVTCIETQKGNIQSDTAQASDRMPFIQLLM